MKMFWWLYNIVFVIGFTLLAPHYLWRMCRRGGYARDFSQRFGRYSVAIRERLGARRRLWVHAVSVGEVYVALKFMAAYRATTPDVAFVLTTNTSTGHRIAQARLHGDDVLLYFPIDLPLFVNRVLDVIQPAALVLTECELWPNLVRLADGRGIPLALLNGRVSDSSYRGYRFCAPLFRNLLKRFAVVLVQGARDAERIRTLGAPPARVHVLGTAKYDVAAKDTSKIELMREILDAAGIPPGAPLIAGGSTWPGEERILVEVYQALRNAVDGLKLVLVPRHFERAAEVERELKALGVNYVKRSTLTLGAPCTKPADVLLLDSTGELVGVYAHASLIFVGWLVLMLQAASANVLTLGDRVAASSGVAVGQVRVVTFVSVALMTAAAVALAGPIGFLGLIVPHICRMLFGPDQRVGLATSAVVGAALLVGAEILCRTVGPLVNVSLIPVGILTALTGGPFFVVLLRRARGRGA